MTTARLTIDLPSARHSLRLPPHVGFYETRDTKHDLYGSAIVRHFFWSEPGPLPWFSRITSHEARLFFAVGAQGWRHRKPPSGPSPGHCFPVHYCSPLFGIVRQKILPSGNVLAPSAVPGRPPGESRSPQLPSLSRLLGLWQPRKGPMPRKGNGLGCANRGTFSIALTARGFGLDRERILQ